MSNIKGINLEQYFDRIGFVPDHATYENLANLQLKHMQSFPFENLDPYTGTRVSLQLPDIEDKLIKRHRGGYCYEQNLLFANVLQQLGYEVYMLAARVVLGGDNPMPAKTHMLLLVRLGSDYIVDTGFGGNSPTAPLRLYGIGSQSTPHGAYKITELDGCFELQAQLKSGLKNLYQFSLCQMLPADYEPMNYYMGARPESHFCQQLLLSKLIGNSRISLHNQILSVRDSDHNLVEQDEIDNADQWLDIAQDRLDINIDEIKNNPDKLKLFRFKFA